MMFAIVKVRRTFRYAYYVSRREVVLGERIKVLPSAVRMGGSHK